MSDDRTSPDAEDGEEQVEDLDVTPEEADSLKGGGKRPPTDIVITKPIDKSSPIL
jgi:hypothetical protein